MALVIPPDFWQASIPLKNEAVLRPAVITFGVNLTSYVDPTAQAPDDVLAAFSTGFESVIDPSVTVGPCSLFHYEAGGEGGSIIGTGDFVGTRVGNNSIPPQVAAIIRKRTSRAGRAGRGRFFLPWCVDRDDVQEDGNISSTEVPALQSAADDFLDALVGFNINMVILHDDGIVGSTTPNTVSSLSVDAHTGTQRRRNRRS